MLNASKTTAQRTSLGTSFANFIEWQKARFDGPAGTVLAAADGEAGYRLADYPAISAWIVRFRKLPWYAPITEP